MVIKRNYIMILAVIPARGGSRRLPGKNIAHLCGKPLIGWTIDAGRASDILDKLVVSTDDTDIKNVSIESKDNPLKDVVNFIRIYKNSAQLIIFEKMLKKGLINAI